MSRIEGLTARNILAMCRHVWDTTSSDYYEGCPFHKNCGKMPDQQCFYDLLDWMQDSDPGDTLGPGEMTLVGEHTEEDLNPPGQAIEIIPAPRPATQEEEDKVCLSHYSELLQKLAQAVPLPGAPTYADCVDEAIRIIEEWKAGRAS